MDPLSMILALVAIIMATVYYFKVQNPFEKHAIPCASSLPILGSTWKGFFKSEPFVKTMQDVYNTHKDAKYIGMYELATPVILIRDIELIKSITVKNFEHFHNHRNFVNESQDPLFAKNLFLLQDERWKELRNTISPTFTSSRLKSMFVLMRDCAKRYGDILVNLPADEKVLELKDTFTRYTNDVIASCAFGINIDSMTDRENKFYLSGKEFTNFDGTRLLKFLITRSLPWLSRMFGFKLIPTEVEEFFKEVVENNVRTREEKNIVRPDMIQLMMETRKLGTEKELTIADMTGQSFVFFVAGFDSVSTLMCFAAYEIGVNQEVQRKLQAEIDQVLEECDGEATYEAINGMKYLDGVVYEALRMYPVAISTDRVCTKRFELPPALPGLKPYVLERGSYIQIPIYSIQHDEKHYREPEKFDPERYQGDTKKDLNSGILLPFGLGPRVCIGNRFALMETKVLLFHVFAKCNLKPCEKTAIPMVLSKKMFTMMAENGYWFEIEPRKISYQI